MHKKKLYRPKKPKIIINWKQFASYPVIGGGFTVLLLIIGLLFLLRGCSTHHENLGNHTYRIARHSSWYPLQLMGREQYMQGLTTDLLFAIARERDLKIELLSAGAGQLYDNLNQGFYDGVLGILTPNVRNNESYLFSDPFYLTGPVLIVPVGSKITSIKDLEDKAIGVQSASSAIVSLAAYPSINWKTFDNMNQGLDQLINNRLDAVILDNLQAYAYTQGYYADKLKIVSSPLSDEGLRLISKHNAFGKHLVQEFNAGLEELKKKNIYKELLHKWDFLDPDLSQEF